MQKNENGSKHHCLLPLLIVTANTFLTMCMVRTCALWWSRGELNPLFEHFTPFYCALLPAFLSVFRTFLFRLIPARDGFWRVKSTWKSTWGTVGKVHKGQLRCPSAAWWLRNFAGRHRAPSAGMFTPPCRVSPSCTTGSMANGWWLPATMMEPDR